MLRLLFAVSLVLALSCERGGPYTNQFTTPVSEISPTQVRLENGRRVSIPKAGRDGTTVLVLVRHAEKAEGGADPHLTDEGRQRAEKLAGILKKLDLKEVYASPYERTKQTAEPAATSHGLKVSLYDPRRLEDFKDNVLIRNKGQRVLIVGHSNTTPELVNLLTGRKGYEPFAETDYSNLFVVSVERGGKVSVFSMRYGVGP